MDADGYRMTGAQAAAWYRDRDPGRPAIVGVLMLLDGAPDGDRLRAAHDRAARLWPPARAYVREPAVPVGPPVWLPDPAFDLDRQLRHVELPGAGGTDRLMAFAQDALMTPLDRSGPLWDGTLITGGADGRAAYLLRVHQSLTDGAGRVPLASLLLGRRPARPAGTPAGHADPSGNGPSPWALAAAELAEQVATLPLAAGRLVAAGTRALTRPAGAVRGALELGASLRRTAALRPARGSDLFHGRVGGPWLLATLACPLSELRAAARAANGSPLEAYLAALFGGLRRYHERHGARAPELPAVLCSGGPRPRVMFGAPTGPADPEERIAAIRGLLLSLRAEPAMTGGGLLVPILKRLPAMIAAAVPDVAVSEVPGVTRRALLAGTRVDRIHRFEPPAGAAISATLQIHAGICGTGLIMDGSVVPDPAALVDCLRRDFDEVLRLGRARARPAR
ncbi:wax ester/triacylglycerol synthase domain-containing protein [Actinoplanes awajinensis]|uniref:diacylglycerol O-acyltransferase n=1 Tax=Actinoplanes awajinensis subsp. mycoplanecinus TaxID=135947 RepID=A0A101JB10_9ACTN|nr:wax ester/triacylglycerol synthase domain-containing protein [Actinoplanes awajinensis]KUL23475.1 hypothetical protein ADL15_45685 [Actinoplanes awajinensis subsp. mycoplanecinus]